MHSFSLPLNDFHSSLSSCFTFRLAYQSSDSVHQGHFRYDVQDVNRAGLFTVLVWFHIVLSWERHSLCWGEIQAVLNALYLTWSDKNVLCWSCPLEVFSKGFNIHAGSSWLLDFLLLSSRIGQKIEDHSRDKHGGKLVPSKSQSKWSLRLTSFWPTTKD